MHVILKEADWTRRTHSLASTPPVHLELLVYVTPVDTPEDLIAWMVVAAADIKSMPGIFERVRESFLRRLDCAMTSAATTSKNSSNNQSNKSFCSYY
ncbi:hypothetical protein AVEN_259628-1 [Araneus ventricosus]|uniref:Uncharacterized protein n=1 Tax=Araneus ventricosus TaxID=182803 RepID=A0A4Y2W110_ARAVE|nr:hypothetical protein AVEN_259628-1 [Araneus ventricosus]